MRRSSSARGTAVGRLAADPLMRAFRVDKMTLAALEATLRLALDPAAGRSSIPLWAFLNVPGREPPGAGRAAGRGDPVRAGPRRRGRRDDRLPRRRERPGRADPVGRRPDRPPVPRRARREGDLRRALRLGDPAIVPRVQGARSCSTCGPSPRRTTPDRRARSGGSSDPRSCDGPRPTRYRGVPRSIPMPHRHDLGSPRSFPPCDSADSSSTRRPCRLLRRRPRHPDRPGRRGLARRRGWTSSCPRAKTCSTSSRPTAPAAAPDPRRWVDGLDAEASPSWPSRSTRSSSSSPIARPRKILCWPGNYAPRRRARRDRGRAGRDLPLRLPEAPDDHPDAPGRPDRHPRVSPDHVDWECELGVVIGRPCRDVSEAEALGLRRRLHGRQRRDRPQVHAEPRPEAARARQVLRLAPRQVARHLLPDGPVHPVGRRVGRPAGLPIRLTVNGEIEAGRHRPARWSSPSPR